VLVKYGQIASGNNLILEILINVTIDVIYRAYTKEWHGLKSY
jgi:hypothetical protein